jgi:hypothetical protein
MPALPWKSRVAGSELPSTPWERAGGRETVTVAAPYILRGGAGAMTISAVELRPPRPNFRFNRIPNPVLSAASRLTKVREIWCPPDARLGRDNN